MATATTKRMKRKARVGQVASQVRKYGTEAASWYCFWIDPKGNKKCQSCGPGATGKALAEDQAEMIHVQITRGQYETIRKDQWEAFRAAFDRDHRPGLDCVNSDIVDRCLRHFERLAKPKVMTGIDSQMLSRFVIKRKEEGVSPATINKELRCLRMTLRVAEDWEYISKVPKFMFQAVPRRKLTFVPKEHFAAMYNACHAAILPASIPNVTPETWWKAILCVAYMTGWRIGQIRELKWADVDLTAGVMLSRAEDNKGGDDVELPLHPVIVTHLKTLQASFDTHVFPWNEGYNQLWTEFKRIQGAAVLDDGSPLPKRGKFGRWYGFHDLRRGFATRNVGKFSLLDLQKLMQHKSLKTTQLYLEMGESIKKAVAEIDVPDVFGKADAG